MGAGRACPREEHTPQAGLTHPGAHAAIARASEGFRSQGRVRELTLARQPAPA